MLAGIALALAGRAGARLAALLGLAAGRSSLLRLVMALPDPQAGTVTILGAGDFAFRRGRDYGTLLVNAQTGQPVDLLGDREADTFATWLKAHPGTEIICRDRAGAYADGARQGAPDAAHVADRWHLYHNLAEHVGKAVARHRGCLHEAVPEPEPQQADGGPDAPDLQQAAVAAAARRAEESALAVRTRQRYELVQALRAQGKGIKPIMRETGLAKETVRRFFRAATVDELLAKVKDGRPSLLDEYKPYLHQRWNEGCTNVRQLHAELTGRGYQGGYGTIRDYVLPFRQAGAAPPAVPGPPKARDLASWILTDPDNLGDDATTAYPQVTAHAGLVLCRAVPIGTAVSAAREGTLWRYAMIAYANCRSPAHADDWLDCALSPTTATAKFILYSRPSGARCRTPVLRVAYLPESCPGCHRRSRCMSGRWLLGLVVCAWFILLRRFRPVIGYLRKDRRGSSDSGEDLGLPQRALRLP